MEEKEVLLSESVNRKREDLQRLNEEYYSLISAMPFATALEQEDNMRQTNIKKRNEMFIKSVHEIDANIEKMQKSLVKYEPPQTEVHESERAPSPPRMGTIPASISPFCHIEGLFPASTRQAVETGVEELNHVGDSKELLKKLNEDDSLNIPANIKSKASQFSAATMVEKQADLARRIALLNEILNEN